MEASSVQMTSIGLLTKSKSSRHGGLIVDGNVLSTRRGVNEGDKRMLNTESEPLRKRYHWSVATLQDSHDRCRGP